MCDPIVLSHVVCDKSYRNICFQHPAFCTRIATFQVKIKSSLLKFMTPQVKSNQIINAIFGFSCHFLVQNWDFNFFMFV